MTVTEKDTTPEVEHKSPPAKIALVFFNALLIPCFKPLSNFAETLSLFKVTEIKIQYGFAAIADKSLIAANIARYTPLEMLIFSGQ